MPSEWSIKDKYDMAFRDMVELRLTIMKYLLDRYGIEEVREFFEHKNPEWIEKLRIGKMKRGLARALSKLAPKQVMKKMADAVVEQVQYIVPLENIWVGESNNDYIPLSMTNCPLLKRFNKMARKLKFDDIQERYICEFVCRSTLDHILSVGRCTINATFIEKGCEAKIVLIKS